MFSFKALFLKVASIFQQHPYSPSSSTSAESSSQTISTSPTSPLCDKLHKYKEIYKVTKHTGALH